MGYSQYINLDVISIGYPSGDELASGSGKIINIKDFEFEHNVSTEEGSLGSPIILLNTLKIIGIHKFGDLQKYVNVVIFIAKILDEIDI